MEEKLYKYEVCFSIKDISENPNSSLSTECCRLLLCNENLAIPEQFIIEKNLKYQEGVRKFLWIKFREMIKKLYNEKRYDPENTPALVDVEDRKDRINFDVEFNLSVTGTTGVSCRAQFKFSRGWEYVTVILKTGSVNKTKIIKKTDQHWLDFFEMFSKSMTQEASFGEILRSIKKHALEIIKRSF